MHSPLPHPALESAVACHLVEPGGARWEVSDVELADGRAWVRARPVDGDGEHPHRVFDTVLWNGAHLEWSLADGRRVRAVAGRDGEIRWEGDLVDGDFFNDGFL